MYGKEFGDRQHMRDLVLNVTKNKLFGKTDLFSRDIMAGIAKNEVIDDRKVGKVSTSMGGGWSTTPKYTLSYKNKIRFSDNCFIDFYISRSSLPTPAGQPRVNVRESDESLAAVRLLLHYNKAFGFLTTDFNLHLYSEIVALDATNDTVEKAINVAFDQLMNDRQQQAYDTVQRFRSRVQTIRKIFDESIG